MEAESDVLSSSADGDRQFNANSRNDSAPSDGSSAGESLGRELLDSVLRQTAQAETASDAPTASDLSALRDVAERHRGKPLTCQPVVVELVQAVLKEQFEPVVASTESWSTMCAGIAQTLYEDPVSRDRLDSLWSRLMEGGK